MPITLDKNSIFESAIGNVLGGVGIIILVFLFKILWKYTFPHLYMRFRGRKFYAIVEWLRKTVTHPYFKLLLIGLLLILVNVPPLSHLVIIFSFIIFIISWTLIRTQTEGASSPPTDVLFADDFASQNTLSVKWEIKTGQPFIDQQFGKPAPDLELKYIQNEATNSFVWVKNIKRWSGVIECDFNIEQKGLFNIVLYGDADQDNWYMVRYDSRPHFSDGFIIKDKGHGANWREYAMSGTTTTPRLWHKARIEFNERKIKMYRDGEFILQMVNPRIFGERIGIFNEVNDVHVDNFTVSDLRS